MDYKGIKALVMGLGLHGGGLESARFLLKRGATVTVTDLRDKKTLAPSIEQLDNICCELKCEPVRYILGKHEIDDFKNACFVVKNPGVRPDSPFLKVSKKIETDLSLFLRESPAKLFAVTGTKGKSGTASALHWILSMSKNSHIRTTGSGTELSLPFGKLKGTEGKKGSRAFLGGNITVSPLTFLDDLTKDDDVVLELSSFQLGDIKNHVDDDGMPILKPAVSILTSIMSDHMDRYTSMDEYIDDKRNIYRGQDASCITIAGDDEWGESFRAQTKARPLIWSRSPLAANLSGGWISPNGTGFARLIGFEGISEETLELVPHDTLVPGGHQKLNMLCAALAAYATGKEAQEIHTALKTFRGVEHRLEFFHEAGNIRFYNDSAATIPEAAAACIEALSAIAPLVLVTGGTDKNLDFSPIVNTAKKAKAIILLAGTGSDKLARLLDDAAIAYLGPFDSLEKAVERARGKAASGDIVALSPGCASFGMFLNEFDRGRRWKEAVYKLTG